tara:strand:- start:39 stop:212 length:174 start_codon:yes stop_codon:yes gene_type:complete
MLRVGEELGQRASRQQVHARLGESRHDAARAECLERDVLVVEASDDQRRRGVALRRR